jgi:hypothetical protein
LLLIEYANGEDFKNLIKKQNKKLIRKNTWTLDQFYLTIKYSHDKKCLHQNLRHQIRP